MNAKSSVYPAITIASLLGLALFMGLLSGQAFTSTMSGDSSLQRRPMERVAAPLRFAFVVGVEDAEVGAPSTSTVSDSVWMTLDRTSPSAPARIARTR